MKINIEVPPSPCLGCGEINDSASTREDYTPVPGSYALCAYCGHIAIFADDLTLRNPTDAEMIEIAGDPRLIAYQKLRPGIEKILRRKK